MLVNGALGRLRLIQRSLRLSRSLVFHRVASGFQAGLFDIVLQNPNSRDNPCLPSPYAGERRQRRVRELCARRSARLHHAPRFAGDLSRQCL